MHNTLNILAVDSSQAQCSLSLFKDSICESELNTEKRKHSDHLLLMLDSLLNKTVSDFNDIDLLAYSSGPGSFTGLRLSATFVQALAYANNLRTVCVSSLELLATAGLKKYPHVKKIVCLIDARVDGIYWAVFTKKDIDIESRLSCSALERNEADRLSHFPHEALYSHLNVADTLFVGDGVDLALRSVKLERNESNIYDLNIMPHAQDLVYIAREREKQSIAALEVEPVYLRGADAWKKMVD